MKKKILIISAEVWRPESDGGNVLTNLFSNLRDEFEFAQIYCNSQLPNNDLCCNYFQFSDSNLLSSVFSCKPYGHAFSMSTSEQKGRKTIENYTSTGKIYWLKRNMGRLSRLIRDVLWRLSKWKTEELRNFVTEFNPDIVFAPMYDSPHMARLDKYVAEITGKKLISYVSDDHLTFKQFSLSPFYWIHRLISRNEILSLADYYKLIYTMTDEQKDSYEKILHVPMKILRKGYDFNNKPEPKNVTDPIKIIYGGNIVYGRYKTLHKLKEIIAEFNTQYGHTYELYIYTQTVITKKYRQLLHDNENSFLMGKISLSELENEYKSAGIALHVESFDLSKRLDTRMSFSTKIVDLMHSNCCIMAICWDKSSPYKYLNKEDAAICVNSIENVNWQLKRIKDNPQILSDYAQKAWECGRRNHDIYKINDMILEDFNSFIEKASSN